MLIWSDFTSKNPTLRGSGGGAATKITRTKNIIYLHVIVSSYNQRNTEYAMKNKMQAAIRRAHVWAVVSCVLRTTELGIGTRNTNNTQLLARWIKCSSYRMTCWINVYNLLLTITCGFTLSCDTSPFSASLTIVCPVVAFLSIMDDSFVGSVATKTMMTLKSTFTLPFLEKRKERSDL